MIETGEDLEKFLEQVEFSKHKSNIEKFMKILESIGMHDLAKMLG